MICGNKRFDQKLQILKVLKHKPESALKNY